jgi:hypothetical protein
MLRLGLIITVFLFTSFLQADLTPWPYGTIHVIGDSHCPTCFTNCATWSEFCAQTSTERSNFVFKTDTEEMRVPFTISWLGPRTMHRVGRDGISRGDFGVNIRQGDLLVFVFGEIDIRIHIGRQVYKLKRDLNEVIRTLAKNYIQRILEAQATFQSQCVVYSVIPPNNKSFLLDGNPSDPFYPSVPLEERVKFTRMLNACLAQKCQKNKIKFLDITDIFSDSDGSLNGIFSDGIHIMPEFNAPIKNRLISLLLDMK